MIPFAGQTVTVYNRREVKQADERTRVAWVRRRLDGCYWARRALRAVEDGHARVNYTLICKIPESPDYLPPDRWDALEDVRGLWTLAAGDIIVLGAVNDEIDGDNTINDMLAKYERRGIMRVTAVQDRCAGRLGHYLAQGV
ncbi:MAG: hypothetical protein Q4D04_05540 [Clostridia bacterium]|nr:hypothetical protein [Clostridia bacterium]